MKGIRRTSQGFSIVELGIVFIVVAIIAALGWLTYRKIDHTVAPSLSSTAAMSFTAPKNCAVSPASPPSGWQTFTTSTYNYSISYPKNWSASGNSFSGSNGVVYTDPSQPSDLYGIDISAPGGTPYYSISINPESISQAVGYSNSVNKTSIIQSTPDSGTTFKVLDEFSCSYASHPAERIDTEQTFSYVSTTTHKRTTTPSIDTEFFVSANGYTYKFDTGELSIANSIQNPIVLEILESQKFN